jgi:hypothetical protein
MVAPSCYDQCIVLILEIAVGVALGILSAALIISFVAWRIDPHERAIREHDRRLRREWKRAGMKCPW